MTDKSLKIGAFLIIIGFSILISFVFFCMSITHNQNLCNNFEHSIYTLIQKIDSLENVVNTSFKQKKDTVLIQVAPQTIKVYCTERQ